MKKILLLFFLAPFILCAQRSMQKYYQLSRIGSRISPDDRFLYGQQAATLDQRRESGIREIRSTRFRKGKEVEGYVAAYNLQGRLLSWNDNEFAASLEYLGDTLLTGISSRRKRKSWRWSYAYDELGRLVSGQSFSGSRQTSSFTVAYDAQGRILSNRMKEGRHIYELSHSYDDEGKLARDIFLIDGKIRKEWIFDCKPEGEMLASRSKDVTSMCTYREESPDGTRIVFSRIVEGGKPYLVKKTFAKDSVMESLQKFYNDTVLVFEQRRSGNRQFTSGYKQSGKRTYRQETEFDDLGNIVSSSYYPGQRRKPQTRSVYGINTDGTIGSKVFYWKGKRESSEYYTYRFF